MARKALVLLVASLIPLLMVANHVVAESAESAESAKPTDDSQMGRERQTRVSEARQCRLDRISASQPEYRIQSEGGITEFWDEYDPQFLCTGLAAIRNIIQPNSLSLPNYSPSPRLVYIQQGRGLLGVTFPGCAETYQSSRGEGEREEQGRRGGRRDEHQKVHRVRQGDIVALAAGVAHWCHNDGNEDLITVSVNDLNSQANQLDQKLRSYYLAGGDQQESRGRHQHHHQYQQTYQNVLRGLGEDILSEALNVDEDTVRNMQRDDERGYIVRVREDMRVIRPEEYEEEGHRYRGRDGTAENGLEETLCTMRINYYLDEPREAEIYSRHAGRVNSVNKFKLPILAHLDMSAEKVNLLPHAIHAPHWNINAHTIVYITQGDARVQIVGSNGQTVMDDVVEDGDMFAIPQYFVSVLRAGRDGVEWVSFKTSGMPMKSPIGGLTSVYRAMPAEVISEAYGIGIQEALNLKYNTEHQTMLLPGRRHSRPRE